MKTLRSLTLPARLKLAPKPLPTLLNPVFLRVLCAFVVFQSSSVFRSCVRSRSARSTFAVRRGRKLRQRRRDAGRQQFVAAVVVVAAEVGVNRVGFGRKQL